MYTHRHPKDRLPTATELGVPGRASGSSGLPDHLITKKVSEPPLQYIRTGGGSTSDLRHPQAPHRPQNIKIKGKESYFCPLGGARAGEPPFRAKVSSSRPKRASRALGRPTSPAGRSHGSITASPRRNRAKKPEMGTWARAGDRDEGASCPPEPCALHRRCQTRPSGALKPLQR